MTNAHANYATIHINKSAMTVVDALEKVGAKVDGVDPIDAKSNDASPPTGMAVHRVTWEPLADSQVRAELRRLEQLGEVQLRQQS